MNATHAYLELQRKSPEALDAVESMIDQGWSAANVARLLSRKYRTEISRLILPAAQLLESRLANL